MKIYLKCISKEEWPSRFSVRPEQLVVSLVALCAAKCIGSPVPYSSQMWPPRCWFLSWKPLASSWELLWFKKRIEKCRRGCFGGVWLSCGVGFSVSIYLPYSWCVTCRKFAFLFCLGCNWAVFLISQVKLDTTEFLEKPFFCYRAETSNWEIWNEAKWLMMRYADVKCISDSQVFLYPLLLLAFKLWMEKKKKIVKLKLNQRWWWSSIYQLQCEHCCEVRRHCLSWKQLLRAWWNPSFSGTMVVGGQPESFLGILLFCCSGQLFFLHFLS